MLVKCFYNGEIAAALQEMQQTRNEYERTFTSASNGHAFPPLSVNLGEDGYTVTAEIPGVDPEKLEIIVSEDTVTVSGNREAEKNPHGSVWHKREREYGAFSRSIRLPFKVDETNVSAKAVNGLLRLVIAKPAAKKPVRVPVQTA